MKKEFPCIESTLEIELGQHMVEWLLRIWVDKDELVNEFHAEVDLKLQIENWYNGGVRKSGSEILRFVVNFPRVNAVQLKEPRGVYGTVVYTVNFNEDPHG